MTMTGFFQLAALAGVGATSAHFFGWWGLGLLAAVYLLMPFPVAR